MANLTPKTIAELPNATTAGNNDLFAISSSGTSKSLSFSNLKSSIGLTVVSGSSTGSTVLERIQNAVTNGVIPVGKPFIGTVLAGAYYFVCGYLYNSPANGFVMVGWYNGSASYAIQSGTWTAL